MRILIPIVFMLIFLAFLAGANIYLSRRFGYYFGIDNLRWIFLFFAVSTVFMIAGLAGFTNSLSVPGSMLYKLAATLMGLVLYMFISALLFHLLSVFVTIKPDVQGLLVLALALGISVYGIINAYSTRVRKVEIPVRNLESEFTLMNMSDIHIGHFRGVRFMGRLVKKTNRAKPDIVVITGDLFDGRIRLKQNVLEPLEELKSPAFFIDGNHDGYTGVNKVKKLVANTGVRVLENEVVDLELIQLVGLNHMAPDSNTVGMHDPARKETMKSVLPQLNISTVKPSVLLHHSPDGIEFASKAGIDVYLAGHTHAGQLFPVTLINDLIFKYNRGLNNYNGTRIFVSPGAGTFGPPMRVGTRSEINLIKLVPEK